MKELFKVFVNVTEASGVKGATREILMLAFDGTVEGDAFCGKVLPYGVDTQSEVYGEPRLLSARYLLEGKDCAGDECRIYIENNSCVQEDGSIIFVPTICTNSKALAYLETATLRSIVDIRQDGVTIHICEM